MDHSKYPRISLKAARVNAGYTQRESAKKLGVCLDTLKNYESGRTVPQYDTVERMSALYGISADFLFFGS